MNCGWGRLKYWPSKMLVFPVALYQMLRGLPLLQLKPCSAHTRFLDRPQKSLREVFVNCSYLVVTQWQKPNVQVVKSSR